MSRAIVFTSGKGGVGKSSLCVCVGRELVKRGKQVVLIDTDATLNNLDIIMDVDALVCYDLCDVFEARCRLSQALVKDKGGVFLLPTTKGYGKSVTDERLKKVVGTLKTQFDYILIDCPAGIEEGFFKAVCACDEAIVITTPHLSSVKDATKVISLLHERDIEKISFILNRVRGDKIIDKSNASVADVESVLSVPVCGVVPESDEINNLSSVCGFLDDGEGRGAVQSVCDYIETGRAEHKDYSKRYQGLIGYIRSRIKRRV